MQDEVQFSRLDYAFARFLTQHSQLSSRQAERFESIALRLSKGLGDGHSCIIVNTDEQSILLASGMVDEFGSQPLVLEKSNLYLHRYWSYECQLANRIVALTRTELVEENFDELLAKYFPVSNGTDWQKLAAKTAVKSPFTMITGGPGTGKTTTVVKILALLQETSEHPFSIALAAPTGKASMKLQESIGHSKSSLPCSEAINKLIPEQVITIHRLLGAQPPSPYFKYNSELVLPYDIVVVDEVSMIDLSLMSKLVSALKANARLILLGDKDQLASVETGSVLADLTDALPQFTQELKTSYRFSGEIKIFADAVNAQESKIAWELLEQENEELCLLKGDLIDYIVNKQLAYMKLIAEGEGVRECFVAFNAFQVLCATRQGHNSVDDINYRVAQQLKEKRVIQGGGEWYTGRPVMITQNDATLRLYNGDIGLCMPDVDNRGQLMVFFVLPDGSIRKYMPARLPSCETVFAMTIHKSQGSEFKEVLLVLPDVINPILTKELIYTGITRAKETLKILTNKIVFLETIGCSVQRHSGLAERIKKIA